MGKLGGSGCKETQGGSAAVTIPTNLQPLQEGRLGASACAAVREKMGHTGACAQQQAARGAPWLEARPLHSSLSQHPQISMGALKLCNSWGQGDKAQCPLARRRLWAVCGWLVPQARAGSLFFFRFVSVSPSSSCCNTTHLAGRQGSPAQPQQRGWDPRSVLEACPSGSNKVTISLSRVPSLLPQRSPCTLILTSGVPQGQEVLPSEGRKTPQPDLLL